MLGQANTTAPAPLQRRGELQGTGTGWPITGPRQDIGKPAVEDRLKAAGNPPIEVSIGIRLNELPQCQKHYD